MVDAAGYVNAPLPSNAPWPQAQAQAQPTPPGEPRLVRAFSPDTWSGYMSLAPQLALEAAPYLHGAMVGHEGMASVRDTRRPTRGRAPARRGGRTSSVGRRAGSARASEGALGAALEGVAGAAKSSALIGGAVSVGIHGYKVFQRQESLAEGGANVVGDVAAAAGGGAIGAAASALLTAALGLSGFPLAVVSLGVGLAGYLLGEAYVRRTPAFQKLTQGTFAFLSAASTPARPPAQGPAGQ